MCQRVLVLDVSDAEHISVVGDECHIVAAEPGGPRGGVRVPGGGDVDDYANLVLLCKVHHKCVDDHPDLYPVARLLELKAKHEKRVEQTLRPPGSSPAPPSHLERLTSGNDVVGVIAGAHLYDHDHDELASEEEVELVGGFLQNVQDYGDIWRELESGARVRATFDMKQELDKLDGQGFWVFGGRTQGDFRQPGVEGTIKMTTAVIRVVRRDNPTIISKPL